MTRSVIVLLGWMMLVQLPPIGKADSTFDKSVDFAALRTYEWRPGTPAFNPELHKMIVAALEAEMAAHGFTRVASGADVTLAYYAMAVTYVDLKSLDKIERETSSSSSANKSLGKLVVVMRNKAQRQIWTAATREYVEPGIEKFGATIGAVTARLFETYPKRPAKG